MREKGEKGEDEGRTRPHVFPPPFRVINFKRRLEEQTIKLSIDYAKVCAVSHPKMSSRSS